ncbi:hypothetical protein G9A89_005479 [Geosiphon pyriformis]|nr:hypothetical protein G9A89_005479 [Geosiphon pyriformis]
MSNNARAMQFLRYFSNNNSINKLANTFTIIKQRENEAIQAINANYFTVAQILNQFIHGLCTNHTQAVNLVMNGLSELDSKLKQFTISSELYTYNTAATLSSISISSANLLTDNTDNLSATVTTYLSVTASSNLSAPKNSNTTTKLTLKRNSKAEIDLTKLEIIDNNTEYTQNLNSQNYLNQPTTNTYQQPTLTNNILPATITENKLLDAIFPFKLKELSTMLLFSGAALEEKPIITMYTDAKVDGHFIKLILNSRSTGSIITKQLMNQLGCRIDCAASAKIIITNRATKTPIGKIDNFPIEVNGIMVPIKVLVIETIQY